jgi:hypothetical protein
MFSLQGVVTRSGTTASVPSPGVLCVVGGNNVGKSQLLRDVVRYFRSERSEIVVLNYVEYKFGFENNDAAEAWFKANSVKVKNPGSPEMYSASGGGNPLPMEAILSWTNSGQLGFILDWLIKDLNSSERSILAAGSAGSVGTLGTVGSPLMELFRDGGKEEELSSICERTFGFPLTLDRLSGDLRLRVGKSQIAPPPINRPSIEYADSVSALPTLESQGDGVRNYLGMVLHMLSSTVNLTLIDEPESFLHPAQARALGRHLGATVRTEKRQLLTATHDRDFVIGLLESDVDVTFLRLGRVGDIGSAKALESNAVRSIWNRPELRYSNVLQGLFHRVAVVCEGDADCRWYAAVLDHVARSRGIPGEEALFLPSGGKSGAQNIVTALDAIGVDCFILQDFDALLNPDQLKLLLRHFRPNENDSEIIRIARAISGDLNAERRQYAKDNGIRGLPRGDKQELAKRAVALLVDRRVLLVTVGEMESFSGDIGGKGATWVTAALERRLHEDCAPAEQLLEPVLSALGSIREPAAEPSSDV